MYNNLQLLYINVNNLDLFTCIVGKVCECCNILSGAKVVSLFTGYKYSSGGFWHQEDYLSDEGNCVALRKCRDYQWTLRDCSLINSWICQAGKEGNIFLVPWSYLIVSGLVSMVDYSINSDR